MTATYTTMMTEEDFLEHVGVKGMKWGKRKAEIKNARANRDKLGPNANVQRSEKSVLRRKQRNTAAIAAVAAFALSNITSNPYLALGSRRVSVILAGTTAGLQISAARSANDDDVRNFG